MKIWHRFQVVVLNSVSKCSYPSVIEDKDLLEAYVVNLYLP